METPSDSSPPPKASTPDPFQARQTFQTGSGESAAFWAIPALEAAGAGAISRLPISLRILLESLLRNLDGRKVKEEDVRALAGWRPRAERTEEIPFVVARIFLGLHGVPLLVDLAAMRSAAKRMGRDPSVIEPLVPVALVVDHSVQVDHWSTPDALRLNMEKEFKRNQTRYEFLKWGMQAFRVSTSFHGHRHRPPGQPRAPRSRRAREEGVWYPDTLVGPTPTRR